MVPRLHDTKCPKCGFSGCSDVDFETLGACLDNVFCPECHCEFEPISGQVHKEGECCVELGEAHVEVCEIVLELLEC